MLFPYANSFVPGTAWIPSKKGSVRELANAKLLKKNALAFLSLWKISGGREKGDIERERRYNNRVRMERCIDLSSSLVLESNQVPLLGVRYTLFQLLRSKWSKLPTPLALMPVYCEIDSVQCDASRLHAEKVNGSLGHKMFPSLTVGEHTLRREHGFWIANEVVDEHCYYYSIAWMEKRNTERILHPCPRFHGQQLEVHEYDTPAQFQASAAHHAEWHGQ